MEYKDPALCKSMLMALYYPDRRIALGVSQGMFNSSKKIGFTCHNIGFIISAPPQLSDRSLGFSPRRDHVQFSIVPDLNIG